MAGETEFGNHEFTTSLASSYDRWTNSDFVHHYYNGGGRAVTLLEIGHLREIAEQYAYGDGTEGAFRRLVDQIADEARASGAGSLSYDFGAPYDFGDVAFSHGDGVVRGSFVGRVEGRGAMLRITGNWMARFVVEVMKGARRSEYGGVGER